MVEIIKHQIGNSEIHSVNARDLHIKLEVKTKFATWINNRIQKYQFIENEDFIVISKTLETTNSKNGKGGTVVKEYILTLDMAKELAMVENNEIGRKIRRYFIEIEKQFRANQAIEKPQINLPKIIKDSKEVLELIHLFEKESVLNLVQLDKFMQKYQNFSPLEILGIDFRNHYFIPTELGKIIGKSPVETNLLLEKNGFQIKENGVWKTTEKGKSFAISFQNGSFFQIKWKMTTLI